MDFERGSTTRLEKFVNARYNNYWKRILSIPEDGIKFPENFINREDSIHASEYVLSWLGNLNKIVRIVQAESPLQDLNFLDVGCGTGALLLYAQRRFSFRSYEGFDLQDDLLTIAEERIRQRKIENVVRIFKANGATHVIKHERQLVFMANPFKEKIYQEFYQNNWETMCKTDSFLGLSNDYSIDFVMSLPNSKLLWRDKRRKVSVVSAGKQS